MGLDILSKMWYLLGMDQPIRHRYLADRILLLLLYRPASADEGIERLEDGSVAVRMGPVSRMLKLNSTKLYDTFLFLHSVGYLREVDSKWRWGWVRLVLARPLCQWSNP